MSTKKNTQDELKELKDQFDFSRIRSGKEALEARRSRQLTAKKNRITIRLDQDILAGFRELAGDGAYQPLINQALRDWLTAQSVKELIREELTALISEHLTSPNEKTVLADTVSG